MSHTRQHQKLHAFAQSEDEDNGGNSHLFGRQLLLQLKRQTCARAGYGSSRHGHCSHGHCKSL